MKKNPYSFRNDKKNIFAILADNKKFLMPAVFVLAVVLTIVIALSANKRTSQQSALTANESMSDTYVVPEVTMEENAYPDVNALINTYYTASAEGNSEVISSIYKGLEDTELLKAVAAADYIEGFQNITVYTKPGPVAGSYVAYVYNEVKLYDYETAIPGLETLYICTDENGELYINGDIADSSEIEYLRQINIQDDVIDLNNEVANAYNKMVQSDETLAELLYQMRSGLQVSVGEALASSETGSTDAAQEEASEEASSEESTEEETQVVTTQTIRATDVVNIRSSDSETADILSKTTKGEEFTQLEALANGWSRIEYNGSVAYVKTEYFEVISENTVEVAENTDATEENENTENTENTVNETSTTTESTKVSSLATGKMAVSETVRLRKSENTDSEILEMIYSGSTVNVIEQYANGWAKVEYNNKTGYIKSEFLTNVN